MYNVCHALMPSCPHPTTSAYTFTYYKFLHLRIVPSHCHHNVPHYCFCNRYTVPYILVYHSTRYKFILILISFIIFKRKEFKSAYQKKKSLGARERGRGHGCDSELSREREREGKHPNTSHAFPPAPLGRRAGMPA